MNHENGWFLLIKHKAHLNCHPTDISSQAVYFSNSFPSPFRSIVFKDELQSVILQ